MQRICREDIYRRLVQNINPPHLIEVSLGEGFAREHLPGAIQLSVAELDDWIMREKPELEDEIILYSDDAQSVGAERAAHQLEGMGFNMVRYYPGGKEDWMQARLPLESYDY